MEKDVRGKMDWGHLSAVKDRDANGAQPPVDKFFQHEDLHPPKKKTITIRVDADVLDWFKRQGRGYQTRINQLLRSYMKAHRD